MTLLYIPGTNQTNNKQPAEKKRPISRCTNKTVENGELSFSARQEVKSAYLQMLLHLLNFK